MSYMEKLLPSLFLLYFGWVKKAKSYKNNNKKKKMLSAVQPSGCSWSPAGRKGTSKAEKGEALIIY